MFVFYFSIFYLFFKSFFFYGSLTSIKFIPINFLDLKYLSDLGT